MDGWIVFGVREVSRRERGSEGYFLSLPFSKRLLPLFLSLSKVLDGLPESYSTILNYTVKEVLPKEHHRIEI